MQSSRHRTCPGAIQGQPVFRSALTTRCSKDRELYLSSTTDPGPPGGFGGGSSPSPAALSSLLSRCSRRGDAGPGQQSSFCSRGSALPQMSCCPHSPQQPGTWGSAGFTSQKGCSFLWTHPAEFWSPLNPNPKLGSGMWLGLWPRVTSSGETLCPHLGKAVL